MLTEQDIEALAELVAVGDALVAPGDDAGFPTRRFVRFDRDPDARDRVLAERADGAWGELDDDRAPYAAEDGRPFDTELWRKLEGRVVSLPRGAIVERLLAGLAFAGAFEVENTIAERRLVWTEVPDAGSATLADGRYRFRPYPDPTLLAFLVEPNAALGPPPGPLPAATLRLTGAVAVILAKLSGFALKRRKADGAIADIAAADAEHLVRGYGAAKDDAEARRWLPGGEGDIFLDLKAG